MIQFEESVISKIIVHKVGNDEGKVLVSGELTDYNDTDEEEVFKRIFLKPFVSHSSTFEFRHEVNIEYNVLFKLAKAIYEGADFVNNTKDITHYLASVSKHPQIKDGELFIALFEDILLGGQHFQALGIYKFEDKENFIETTASSKAVSLKFKKGIGTKKPDKALLILFTDEPYTLLIIDNNSNETDYWQQEFIRHKPKNDNVNNTNDFLSMTKQFVTKQFADEFDVTKTDQIDLLNRSVEYFKTHDSFNKVEFEQEVLHHSNIINSFRKFDHQYQQDNELSLADNFDIAAQAVKKQARNFKSILKLDKNFHIYIHGNREMIEQGMDEDGRKFYKIYYEQEH